MNNRYFVKNGDTLEDIAKYYNISVDSLRKANNIKYNELRVGSDIVIPKNKEEYFEYYTIEAGDTLYGVARKYNINPELLASMNGLKYEDYIYPGQEILIPKSNYSYYITMEGDTLDTVADRFKTNKTTLMQNNETIYLMGGQLLVNRK